MMVLEDGFEFCVVVWVEMLKVKYVMYRIDVIIFFIIGFLKDVNGNLKRGEIGLNGR